MADTQLATVQTIPSPAEWKNIFEMASALVPTGFLPDSIKTPAQAAAVMLKGRELGIPPMYALSNIVVIKGKPTCGAELMLALIYRDHGDTAIQFPESTNQKCTIAYRRRGWDKPLTYSFTIQDAQAAGLASGPTWKNYPAAMLRARCISAVARMAFADSIGGMYGYEELGAPVTVVDDQVVIDAGVDVVTGEIIDADPLAESKALKASVMAQAATKNAKPTPDTPAAPKRDYSAIYGAGKDKGLKPDDVKALAYAMYDTDSMTKISDEHLYNFLTYLTDTDPSELATDLYEATQGAEA